MTDRFVLVDRPGTAGDVLHRNPREECNLDDTRRDQEVDEATARALLDRGLAEACRHCEAAGPTHIPASSPEEEEAP